MKLNSLELTNFLPHAQVVLDLAADVTMVFGRNAAGKTAVANAVEFALTGRCRGLVFKKDAAILRRAGAKSMSVCLSTGENEFHNTHRQPQTPALPWPPELTGALCDPMRIVRMSQPDRQRIFQAVLQSAAEMSLAEAAREAKVGISEDELWESILAMPAADIDKAHTAAVDGRRSAKRAVKEIEAASNARAVEGTVEISGKEYDLSTKDANKIRLKIAGLDAKLAEIPGGGILLNLEQLKLDAPKLEKVVAGWMDKRASLSEEVDEVRTLLAKSESKIVVFRSKLQRLVDQEDDARRAFIAFNESNKATCPLSSKELGAIHCPYRIKGCAKFLPEKCCPGGKNPMQSINETLDARIKGLHAKINKGKAVSAEAAEATKSLQAAVTEGDAALAAANLKLGQAQGQLSTTKRDLADAVRWDADKENIDKLTTQASVGRNLLAAVDKYTTQRELAAELTARTKRLQAEVGSYDKLAKLIDGPLRAYLAKAVTTAKLDETLVSGWHSIESDGGDDRGRPGGFELHVEDDGMIVLNDRPIEVASASEQWRAGAAIADLLARSANTGWIILDGCDILDAANRKPLNRWARAGKGNGYESIVLMATRIAPPKDMHKLPEGFRAYWLDHDGTCVRIEE